jgi:hypothetical protein
MRVVIFDEETLEPITVVSLPGMTDRFLEEKRFWRVSLPMQPIPRRDGEHDKPLLGTSMQYVDLEFERFSRVTLTHGEQLSWLCLTRATELAMLLTPDWLPGQRPAIQQLQDENARLGELMMTALSSDVMGDARADR